MDNKTIAKYALSFIGGKPSVSRFYNSDETKSIDIMTSDTGEIKGVSTCATIGVNCVDIGMTSNSKKIRVELLASGTEESEILGNILANISFDIIDTGICTYGMIIPHVVSSYKNHGDLKHAVLMSPVFWSRYSPFETDDMIVTWLMIVPISDAEKDYIVKNGIDAFDSFLESEKVDVLNYSRKSSL